MQTQWDNIKGKIPFGLVISFVVGAVFGLVVLGWWLWPVEYVDTDPSVLRARYKASWVQMVADSYALTGNLSQAQARLQELQGSRMSPEDTAALLAQVAAEKRAAGQLDEAGRLQALANAVGLPIAAVTPGATLAPTAAPTAAPAGGRSTLVTICLALLFVLLVALGVLLIWSYLRGRQAATPRVSRRAKPPRAVPSLVREEEYEPEEEVEEEEEEEGELAPAVTRPIAWDTEAEEEAAPPSLGHFVTTFELGDDGYDESFGIETETGEFLGECGVAISELISSGTPEKPAAFDIWLFDKSDIRTVTKVVASPYAMEDDALHSKLAAKGDVIVAERGEMIVLETAALRVRAQIVATSLGGGDQQPESYFTKFTVELSPSRKMAA